MTHEMHTTMTMDNEEAIEVIVDPRGQYKVRFGNYKDGLEITMDHYTITRLASRIGIAMRTRQPSATK